MPTVFRQAGFEVRIYTFDHPPPHVHVAKAGAIVKVDLATSEIVEVFGTITDRDAKRAERLVAEHSQLLKEAWRRLHGER